MMKQIHACILSFLVIGSLDADEAQLRNLDHRMETLEATRNSCALVNPPARPTQKCDWGGYLTIDPLLLKPEENGLEYVVRTNIRGSSPIISGNSRAKSLNFNWDWGFRLGLGANLAHDAWDVYLNWIYFRTDATRHITPGTDQFLLPVFAHPGNVNHGFGIVHIFGTSSSHWTLHLNELDLEMGRQFFVSKWLTVKPHAGFRTAWVRQSDHIKYTGLGETAFPQGNVNMKCNYWGLGVKAGIDTQWGIGCGWSLIANYSASMLYGFFNTNHAEAAVFADGTVTHNFILRDFFHLGRIITDFLIGLRYDYMFCEERYHIGVAAGWEHHMFFGQNQFIRFTDFNAQGNFFTNQGDLTLQGFSIDVRFDF